MCAAVQSLTRAPLLAMRCIQMSYARQRTELRIGALYVS
jgi:hypothetical protein